MTVVTVTMVAVTVMVVVVAVVDGGVLLREVRVFNVAVFVLLGVVVEDADKGRSEPENNEQVGPRVILRVPFDGRRAVAPQIHLVQCVAKVFAINDQLVLSVRGDVVEHHDESDEEAKGVDVEERFADLMVVVLDEAEHKHQCDQTIDGDSDIVSQHDVGIEIQHVKRKD